MTNGTSPGTERGVIYKIVAVDYKTTICLPNGKVFKGIFNLQKVGSMEDFAKGLLYVESDVFISEIVPVPITKEILEKNGWRIYDGGEVYSSEAILHKEGYEFYYDFEEALSEEDKDYLLQFGFLDKKGEVCAGKSIEMHYIHELQHLLFGLGLDSEMKV